MTVSVREPWRAGAAVKLGESMMVNSGAGGPPGAPAGSTLNRFRAQRLCHAHSVMTRIGSR